MTEPLSEDELADARDLTHSKHHFRRAETYDTCDVCGHDFRDTSMHYKDTDYPRTTSERAHLALLKLPALLSHIDALKAERDGLKEACAPWENGSTEIPDWDSPLHCVFQAGISYTLQQVGAAVGAESWEGGDGTETIEGDVHVEICNILKAADMYEDEIGTHAKIADRAIARTSALKEAAEAIKARPSCAVIFSFLDPFEAGEKVKQQDIAAILALAEGPSPARGEMKRSVPHG